MEEDQVKSHLPEPVTGSLYFQLAKNICIHSFYPLLAVVCGAIIGGVFLKPYLSTKIVVFAELLLSASLLARNKWAWWHYLTLPNATHAPSVLSVSAEPNTELQTLQVEKSVLAALKMMLANRDLCHIAAALSTAGVVASATSMVGAMSRSGGLAGDVFISVLLSSLFPLGAALNMSLRKKLGDTHNLSVSNLPYRSCHAGFTSLLLMLSYSPHGIGTQFSGWLNACMWDANLNIVSDEPSFLMRFLVSTLLFVSLMTAFRHAMVRFSAGYQLFLKRLILFKDSLLDAFRATVRTNALRIDLPDRHPHLHNALATAKWITFIYVLLFAGVAFCPGPLGETIRNHYQDCLRDASLAGNINTNFGLLAFIASVVAAYSTIPVAVMSCSFLSTKKTRFILASSEGILTPCDKKTVLGFSPILPWERLRRVSLKKIKNEEKQYLKLSFENAKPLKLRVSEIHKESLAALLNSADEYAKRCLLDQPVLDLKKQLNDETKSQTMAETKNFSSTVFSLLKAGDRLKESFRIVRKLAGKSMSAVYLARNASDELVVIKEFILPDNVDACDKLDAAFAREYSILKELNHPGVAKVIESFDAGNAKYLVIEHIAGTDLRAMVNKSGARSEASVKALAMSIASIMSYLHAQTPAILHRDLTPDNLMIDDSGELKLVDFGASHQLIEGVTGTLIGKQCYIAPEQLRGKPTIESDIYSFGCTLYFLLVGHDPRALQQSDTQTSNMIVSPLMRELILKCTEFEPEKRLHSFEEVTAMLSASTLDRALSTTDIQLEHSPTPIVETLYGQ